MTHTILIFESNHAFLGEVTLDGGAFKSAQFSKRGDAVLGHVLRRWQMHGLPKLGSHAPLIGEHKLAEYRIHKQSDQFGDALLHWVDSHGFHAIVLNENEIGIWGLTLELPLEDHERFAILEAITVGSSVDAKRVKKFLEDAVALARKEADKLEKDIGALRIERAKKLVKKHT